MSEELTAQTPALVSLYLDALERRTSDEFEAQARAMARRAELEHPINRAPSTVAASAVYAAGLLVNEKVTQRTVSDASGVCTAAIRECYPEILEAEGIATKAAILGRTDQDSSSRRSGAHWRFVRAVRRRLRRD